MPRVLSTELIKYIDDKLINNAIAINARHEKHCDTLSVEVAKCLVGIKEKTGRNDGVLVELLQKVSGGHRGDAWCAFTQMAIIGYVELVTGIKSKVKNSGSCASIRAGAENTPEIIIKGIPRAGDLCIWIHTQGSLKGNGHIGMVCSANEEIMFLVEGNTSQGLDPDGKVESNGQGCHYTKRSMHPKGDMQIKMFVRPFEK